MSNQQLIKTAYIWSVIVLVTLGILAVGGRARIKSDDQNSNQNSNANRSSNRNSNRSATGEKAGMGNLNTQDRTFLMDAAQGGMMEVELGRVAAQKGVSDSVKQFGQRMVDDHSKADTELASVASNKGITLPTTLDEKHQAEVTKLSAMSGAEFDRAYAKKMLSDHTKDVSEFERESTRGTDADLKTFATNTLPTLREHLQMAKALPGNATTSSKPNRP